MTVFQRGLFLLNIDLVSLKICKVVPNFSSYFGWSKPTLPFRNLAISSDQDASIRTSTKYFPNFVVHVVNDEAGFDILFFLVFAGSLKTVLNRLGFIDEDFLNEITLGHPFPITAFAAGRGTADGVSLSRVKHDNFDFVAIVFFDLINVRAIVSRDRAGQRAMNDEHWLLTLQ